MESRESNVIRNVWRVLVITAIPLWGFLALKTFLLLDLYENAQSIAGNTNLVFMDFFIAADCLFLVALAGLSAATLFFVARIKNSVESEEARRNAAESSAS